MELMVAESSFQLSKS